MNLSFCDVDITFFLYICSIVTEVKIVDKKKIRILELDIIVLATCNTSLLRNIFFVLT